jgi:hypothetical protein
VLQWEEWFAAPPIPISGGALGYVSDVSDLQKEGNEGHEKALENHLNVLGEKLSTARQPGRSLILAGAPNYRRSACRSLEPLADFRRCALPIGGIRAPRSEQQENRSAGATGLQQPLRLDSLAQYDVGSCAGLSSPPRKRGPRPPNEQVALDSRFRGNDYQAR